MTNFPREGERQTEGFLSSIERLVFFLGLSSELRESLDR